MGKLRDNLKCLVLNILLPKTSVPLKVSKHSLKDQIFESSTKNPLHCGDLLTTLRASLPVQEQLDKFRCQIKTIIQISRNNGKFKGKPVGKSYVWEINNSNRKKCFRGLLPQLYTLLLNPPEDVLQNHGNTSKRKSFRGSTIGVKRRKIMSSRRGNRDLAGSG